MESGWLISYIALWVVTIALALVVLAHSRLLGILHHRIGPAAAKPLADGPEVGSNIERLRATTVDGREWNWSFPSASELLLVFVSPQCQTCDALMLHIKDFVRAHPELPLALASTLEDAGMNRAYIEYRRLQRITYVIGSALADELHVEGTPYALLFNAEGRVLAKGLVNHYEHLRSLRDLAVRQAVPEEIEVAEGKR